MNASMTQYVLHAVVGLSSPSSTLQVGGSMPPASGPVAQLLSDPLAMAAIVGGLAVIALNLWFFRLAGRPYPPSEAEGNDPAVPRGPAAILLTPVALAPVALQEEGLTFAEVIRDVPTDPASLFVYTLLAGSAMLVWMANRPRRGR